MMTKIQNLLQPKKKTLPDYDEVWIEALLPIPVYYERSFV